MIQSLAADGMTCILVTHEIALARQVADRTYVTDGGVVVEHGPPAALLDHLVEPRTRAFPDKVL